MEAYLESPVTTALVTVAAVFEGLATFIVALRFYLRISLRQGVKWDDWLALLSLAASWGYAIGLFVVAGQIGVDVIKVDPTMAAKKFVEAVSIGSIILPFVIAPIKISVLFFYMRLFTTQRFKQCVWVATAIISMWGIATFVAQLLIGDPVPSSTWENLEDPKYRFDYFKFGLSVPVLSIIFDGMVLLFPIPPLRKLQVPFYRKICIVGTFWLGSFCLVTGAVRIYYWYQNARLLTDSADPNVNKWRYDTLVQIWVVLEMTVSVIAACLPTLAPIYHLSVGSYVWQKILSLSSLHRSESENTRHDSKFKSVSTRGYDKHVDVADVELARLETLNKDFC